MVSNSADSSAPFLNRFYRFLKVITYKRKWIVGRVHFPFQRLTLITELVAVVLAGDLLPHWLFSFCCYLFLGHVLPFVCCSVSTPPLLIVSLVSLLRFSFLSLLLTLLKCLYDNITTPLNYFFPSSSSISWSSAVLFKIAVNSGMTSLICFLLLFCCVYTTMRNI